MVLSFIRKLNMSPGQRDTGDVIDADDINELQAAFEGVHNDPLGDASGTLPAVLTDLRASVDGIQDGTVPIALAGIADALEDWTSSDTPSRSQSLRGAATLPYWGPSEGVMVEDWGGRTGGYDCGQHYADMVAQAKVANSNAGIPIRFNTGDYWTSLPLVLPRSGLTPQNIVQVLGVGLRETRLWGLSSFPTNRGMIEWEATTTRAWHQRIAGLGFRLPNVADVTAIKYTRTTAGTSSTAATEWLNLDLERLLVVGSNTYHPRLIYLEVGNRMGVIDRVWGDSTPGANPIYDTILFECDGGDYTDYGHVGMDQVGFGYCVFSNIHSTVRNGGWGALFKGRVHSSTMGRGFVNGGALPERDVASLDFVNASNTTFSQMIMEGQAEAAEFRITQGWRLTFNDCNIANKLNDTIDVWEASTAYAIDDRVQDPLLYSGPQAVSRLIWKCTVAGTSGGSAPAWPASGTVVDNTVTWTEDGDAIGDAIVLIDTHHTRWNGRSVTPGSNAFSVRLIPAVKIDADSSDNVFASFDVMVQAFGTFDNEFEVNAVPANHNLIFGNQVYGGTSSATWKPYAVGWHPDYKHVCNLPVETAADYTARIADRVIQVDATAATRTVTLASAAGVAGKEYVIAKVDAGANTVTIEPDGTESIDGDSSFALTLQYERVTISSDGTDWIVAAHVGGL